MSAQEFTEWQVMFKNEQLHPDAARAQHAQVLAALYQGPSSRRGGGGWSAKDFTRADPWVPPAAATTPKAKPARTAAQRMKAFFQVGRRA